jgi:cytochrome c-type biogenesis protein CcsB
LESIETPLAILRWSGVLLAGAAAFLFVREFAGPPRKPTRTKLLLLVAAIAVWTIALLGRGIELGTVPLVTSWEALFFYAWLLLVVFLLFVREEAHRTIGVFLVPLAVVLGALASLLMEPPAQVSTLFQNRLFALHTVTLFLGYSALSIAFCAGVMYLLLFDEIAHKKVGRMFARLPSLDDLDRLGFRTVTLGFSLLTIGILVGMAWAKSEWGVAWVWEPKSVWTLLSWGVYLAYLVARSRWQGQRAAWLAAVGFALSIVTLIGTNALLGAGRHVF